MATDDLNQFINNMLDAKNLSGVSDNVRAQLVDDLRQRLLDQINKALINAIPDGKVGEFEGLLDDPSISDEDAQKFIAASGVDVKRIAASTMLRFYDLYVAEKKS